jgi:hypothetical protein
MGVQMRRALDTARAKLGSLTDRDAILDCFFEHARGLFQCSVLLVVRGDVVQGRAVSGLGTPEALVARLVAPMNEPGIIQRAAHLRRPFVGVTALTDADARLFGVLGRTMPNGLVSPLVVRDRVVAIFLGDVPVEAIQRRAAEARRTPMEVVKEEMLLWSESVGETIERLIIKRKGGPAPPNIPGITVPNYPAPSNPISSFPGLPDFSVQAPLIREVGDEGAPPSSAANPLMITIPNNAPIMTVGASGVSGAFAVVTPEEARSLGISTDDTPVVSKTTAFIGAALALVVAIGGGVWWKITHTESDADRVVVPAAKLAGAPNAIDPAAALDAARGASGRTQLASIRAEIGPGGKVDTAATPKNDEGIALVYTFVSDEDEADVRVDQAGIHAPRVEARKTCGGKPCSLPVPPPTCSFAQIWDAATAAGADPADRALVTYAEGTSPIGGSNGADLWRVEVAGRGRIYVDGAACKPAARNRLRPRALAVNGVPGAPAAVDPMATIALARKQAGLDDDTVLLQLEARAVTANGRVDLGSADGRVIYTFSDPESVSINSRRWRQVELGPDGMSVKVDETHRPLAANFDLAVVPPHCNLEDARAYMMAKQTVAPTSPVRITFGPSVTSHEGRWTMDVGGTDLRQEITETECEAWTRLHRDPQTAPAPSTQPAPKPHK